MSLYYIKLCIGITTSVSLTLSNCVLFISLMQLVNGTQVLNITFLFLLFGAAAFPAAGIVIVFLTCICASL